jgi:FkbM family methyltransferase
MAFCRILHNYYYGYIRKIKGANGDLMINNLVVTVKRNKYVHVGSVKFIRDRAMIYETFIKQMYSVVDVRGKTVIDISAYVGDTAIYFVLRGASKVIALEPNPFAYQEMLENIKLNHLEDKIIPVNAALARKRGKIRVRERDVNKVTSTYYGAQEYLNHLTCVDALTLEDIVERYSVLEGVLKMDCEGCEYILLDTSCQALSSFAQVVIEYHGDPDSLIRRLKKCGFKVSVIPSWRLIVGSR